MLKTVIFFSAALLASACATGRQPCRCPEPQPRVSTGDNEDNLDLERLLRSVVQIRVKVSEQAQADKLKESFEYGTGFFIDERGLILTCAHVLSGVDDPRNIVVFRDGKPLQARPLKIYRDVDLATLLVDAGKTEPLPLASGGPRLGERVMAVGFPYVDVFRDAIPAVSSGHVAGSGRKIVYEDQSVDDLIVTDAFVADGCSGGPLIDGRGRVVGVLRFNLARGGSWLGLSFAEPISAYLEKAGASSEKP